MFSIVKTYRQSIPGMRFIGKKYGDEDRVDGGFGKQWGVWCANGWFDVIEQAAGGKGICHGLYEDGGAYLGMMRCRKDEPFQYWIGEFVPTNTAAPDGFAFLDFPKADLGVCWLYGQMGDLFGHEHECAKRCEENGFKIKGDDNGAFWFFERYGCQRFTTPDDKGNIILDICHFIEAM